MNTVSEGTTTNANRGSRTYTVSGLEAGSYDLELLPATNVLMDEDGNVTFRSNALSTVGSFEVVNGASVGTAGGTEVREVHNVAPINGTITFTIDSQAAGRVIPVVNADADGDNTLDLESGASATTPKAPTEDFGVGGEKEWILAEFTGGDVGLADATIDRVNKDEDYFTTSIGTFEYDASDVFRVVTGEAGTGATAECGTAAPVTVTTFEAALSSGDQLDESSIYAPDPGAQSTFCLEDRTPAALTGVTASEVDNDTITVNGWTGVDPNASALRVYRKTGLCSATLTDYTQVATLAPTATTYNDDGLSATTQYCYVVTQVVDGDESAISNQDDATTTAAGATAQPQSTDTYIVTDTTFPGELSASDVFRVVFDKQMAPVEDGDLIRVRDTQGEIFNLECEAVNDLDGDATNRDANCTFNSGPTTIAGTTYPAGRVLTVTVDGTDLTADNVVTGGNDTLEYPLTIVQQNGFTDTADRPWTPTDDPDNVIDNEGAKAESAAATFTTSAAPSPEDAGWTEATSATAPTTFGDEAGDTVTVTFDNPITVVDGDTVTIDWDGVGNGAAAVVYVCDAVFDTALDVACSGTGTNTLTVTSYASTGASTVSPGNGATNSEVTGSGADGYYGGVASTGYPEDIDA